MNQICLRIYILKCLFGIYLSIYIFPSKILCLRMDLDIEFNLCIHFWVIFLNIFRKYSNFIQNCNVFHFKYFILIFFLMVNLITYLLIQNFASISKHSTIPIFVLLVSVNDLLIKNICFIIH